MFKYVFTYKIVHECMYMACTQHKKCIEIVTNN